jgi:hypothetical protein
MFGSTQEWLRRFGNAVAASDIERELDYECNSARQRMVAAFGGIDASIDLLVDRLWGEVADALHAKLTAAIVPAGPDNRTTLTAFADTARRAGARRLAEATERLLHLPTDYGSIFVRVGRPLIGRIAWYSAEPEPGPGAQLAVSPGAGEASAAAWKSAQALKWHTRLTGTIEQVIIALTQEFHAEAQRAMEILAAAVVTYMDAIVADPDTELEFEKLTGPARREIWPASFDGSAAKIAADLATLRQRANETEVAAGQVASLAAQARRL